MNDTSLHEWEKTGLLSGLEDNEKEICSFMLEEAYDFLTSNRNKLSEKVIDRLLPTTRLIFEMESKNYNSIEYSDLSSIISDVVVDFAPNEYPFKDEAIIFESAKKFISKN